jgi:hypothetical protein
MKKLLLVLAFMTAGLHADAQQNLQVAKAKITQVTQGARAAGSKAADAFNIPKYFKLLKVAKADLQACGISECSLLHKKIARLNEKIQQLENQITVKNRESIIEKRDALSSKRTTLEREYQECLRAKCPMQYDQYLKKRAEYGLRVARVVAAGAYSTAATIGVASVVTQDQIDKKRWLAAQKARDKADAAAAAREYQKEISRKYAPSAPLLGQEPAIYKPIQEEPYKRPESMRAKEISVLPTDTNYPGMYPPSKRQSLLPVDKRSMYADYLEYK